MKDHLVSLACVSMFHILPIFGRNGRCLSPKITLTNKLILQKCPQSHTMIQDIGHYKEYLHHINYTRKLFRSYLYIGWNITIHHDPTYDIHDHSENKIHDDAITK